MAQAVEQLRSLWPDGGAQILERAGLASWQAVVAALPADVLTVPPGPMPPGETLLGRLRDLFSQAGRHPTAIALAQALFERREQALGPEHPETLVARSRLGAVLLRAGELDAAGGHLLRAHRGLRAAMERPDLRAAQAAIDLASYLRQRGEPEQAARALLQAYEIRRRAAPGSVGLLAAQLGELLLELGDDDAAADRLSEAWDLLRQTRGEHDRVTLDRARLLGPLLVRLDQPERALPVLRSLAAWTGAHGTPEERASVDFALGRALDQTDQPEEAYRHLERAIRWTRAHVGDDDLPHPELPQRLAIWSRVVELRGRPAEAEGVLLEALEAERLLFGEASAEVGLRQAAIGDLCSRMRRLDDAIGWIESGLGLLRTALGDDHEVTAVVAERLIDLLLEKADFCFEELRSPDLGWEYIEQGRWICLDILGPEHPSHKTLKYYRT